MEKCKKRNMLCETCLHKEICNIKEEYERIFEDIERAVYPKEEMEIEYRRYADNQYLSITLDCEQYLKNTK